MSPSQRPSPTTTSRLILKEQFSRPVSPYTLPLGSETIQVMDSPNALFGIHRQRELSRECLGFDPFGPDQEILEKGAGQETSISSGLHLMNDEATCGARRTAEERQYY